MNDLYFLIGEAVGGVGGIWLAYKYIEYRDRVERNYTWISVPPPPPEVPPVAVWHDSSAWTGR